MARLNLAVALALSISVAACSSTPATRTAQQIAEQTIIVDGHIESDIEKILSGNVIRVWEMAEKFAADGTA